jgi:hypothetical protein
MFDVYLIDDRVCGTGGRTLAGEIAAHAVRTAAPGVRVIGYIFTERNPVSAGVSDVLRRMDAPPAPPPAPPARQAGTPPAPPPPPAPPAAAARRAVRGLYIMCHGEPGGLFLGQGVNSRNVRDLAPLADRMLPWVSPNPAGGRQEGVITHPAAGFCAIRGCNVASAVRPAIRSGGFGGWGGLCPTWGETRLTGPQQDFRVRLGTGFNFVLDLAETLTVPVTGSVDEQEYNPAPGPAARREDWVFNDHVLTVCPNQSYVYGTASRDGTWRPAALPNCNDQVPAGTRPTIMRVSAAGGHPVRAGRKPGAAGLA